MGLTLWICGGLSLAGASLVGAAFGRYRRSRFRRIQATKELLQPTSAGLKPGPARVQGVARKRKPSEDDVLLSGGLVTLRVQSGRGSAWKLSDRTREARSFHLISDANEEIRVSLPRSARWSIETDAREINTPDQRSVHFELRDGERVSVEGMLEHVAIKGSAGYRDRPRRWQITSRGQPIVVRTEGALIALERTEFAPNWVWAFLVVMIACAVFLLSFPQRMTLSSGSETLLVVLSVVFFSFSLALAVVHASGGWIGSRPWFDRSE